MIFGCQIQHPGVRLSDSGTVPKMFDAFCPLFSPALWPASATSRWPLWCPSSLVSSFQLAFGNMNAVDTTFTQHGPTASSTLSSWWCS